MTSLSSSGCCLEPDDMVNAAWVGPDDQRDKYMYQLGSGHMRHRPEDDKEVMIRWQPYYIKNWKNELYAHQCECGDRHIVRSRAPRCPHCSSHLMNMSEVKGRTFFRQYPVWDHTYSKRLSRTEGIHSIDREDEDAPKRLSACSSRCSTICSPMG